MKRYQFIILLFLSFSLYFSLQAYSSELSQQDKFVGSKVCAGCHDAQFNAWKGSHHDMSMRHASKESVRGNFNNKRLVSNKTTNRFYRKGNEYWVNIANSEGKLQDFQIKYTFGYEPLQQYMVEFEDGRVQLIPFAWDTRPVNEGGQRWFNLYPDRTENHQEFFWTNTGQNWNYMCADCHSTNVAKNFNVDTNTYKTSFSEINVACESCHGAARNHIQWTTDQSSSNHGFSRNLSSPVNQWYAEKTSNTLVSKQVKHTQQVLICAQCHSRRTQISNKNHVDGNAFGERYLLDLITNENYYPDGQVYNENFVYGSFLQSKMYQKGVVCSDCHDPHSAKLKLPVETLCLQCHQSEYYAQKTHHQHADNSSGAQCVNCHMPETTYMEIDARRDHGFHIPRPDLALQLGTPDTCLSCHQDKNSQWSIDKLNIWFPETEKRKAHKQEKDFAAVFSATNLSLSNQQWQSVANELARISQTMSYAPIIRASALTKMANTSNTNTVISIARALKNDDEFIRLGAITALQGRGAQTIQDQKWRLLSPLLSDIVLSVRSSAAFALANHWQQLNTEQQKLLTPVLNEYLTTQDFNNDRSFAHSNKAIIYSYQGKFDEAITAFKKGIAIEPYFVPTYVNLCQVYRQLEQEQQGIKTLKQGYVNNPDNGQLPFELAMSYIRTKDKQAASEYLKQATVLAPQNSHYFYVLGLSLENQNKTQAYKALGKAYSLSQNPQHLYALCDMQVRQQAFQAKQCLAKLAKVAPENVVNQLKIQLKN